MAVVATEEQIRATVTRLAREIDHAYTDPPLLVGILNGSFIFMADLVREMTCDPEVMFLQANSYEGVEQRETVDVRIDPHAKVEGREVLIVEDIVDSGRTLEAIRALLWERRPVSLRVAALLFKSQNFKGSNRPEFVGFEIPSEFVIGYGLDLNGKGRGQSYISTV